ncbi:MAG: BolA family transcriptional regulator [Deltaproteobacteria bacterium]|nr:BolA family transcriptional regulator [Deltaproteobacteria bacterium]
MQQMEQSLRDTFQPTYLELMDVSHLHTGHREARAHGGMHCQLTIVSTRLFGLARLARHRLIYAALSRAMASTLHAIQIHAYTPEEWGQKTR